MLLAVQGGRCCASTQAVLTEKSGSSTKGRTPNIRYFVAKLSIVAIYAFFERLPQGFERKPSCFRRAFKESHPAFGELLETLQWRDCFRITCFLTTFSATIEMVNLKFAERSES